MWILGLTDTMILVYAIISIHKNPIAYAVIRKDIQLNQLYVLHHFPFMMVGMYRKVSLEYNTFDQIK